MKYIPIKKRKQSKSPCQISKQRAWDAFSRYIRLRDCLKTTGTIDKGRCITCGRIFSFNELQAGHFISGRTNSVLFSERGVNAQCKSCNRFHYGRPLEYQDAMIKMYGEDEVLKMRQMAKIPISYRKSDYDGICIFYKREYEKLYKEAK
jgi:hypothetical protein